MAVQLQIHHVFWPVPTSTSIGSLPSCFTKQSIFAGDVHRRPYVMMFNKNGNRKGLSSSVKVRSSLETAGPTVVVGQVTEVNQDTFWPLVNAAGDKTVVLDMYTQWCGPCKVIAPKFKELSEKYLDVVFLKLDCNQENRMVGRRQGRGRSATRGTRPPLVGRRNTRAHPNIEERVHDDTNANGLENNESHNLETEMEGNFAQILLAAIPSIAAEIRLQEKEGNGEPSGTGTHVDVDAGTRIDENAGHVVIPISATRAELVKRGCEHKTFKSCDPKPFDGKQDAAATHQWLREMESVIIISECHENQKVKFASHSLISEALFWWDSVQQDLGGPAIDTLTWESFKRMVLARFCPKYAVDKAVKDFMNLEVGTMTHREYTTRYNEMSRMVPQLVATEEDSISNYIRGFPTEVRRLVKGSAPSTFQKAIELTADLFDEVYGTGGRPESTKRKREDSPTRDSKKKNSENDSNVCKPCKKRLLDQYSQDTTYVIVAIDI